MNFSKIIKVIYAVTILFGALIGLLVGLIIVSV